MNGNQSPFPPSSNIVAYLRDSGGDEQDLSIAQQEKLIRSWAIENGYTLLHIYKDEASPGSSVVGRKAFLHMIQDFHAETCQAAGVVLWKYNRFARDIDDAQFFKADLRRRGYIIHSLNDPIPDNLDGRFFEAAIDWMSARYIEDLKTDVKRGQRHILKEYGAIGGVPPRGFKREPIHIGSRRDGRPHVVHRWVPDPECWHLCRQAWEMRARGASYREINQATALFKSLNSYVTFFRNRIYIGEMVVSDLVIPDYVEPMIDQQTWDAVQSVNNKNAERSLRGANNDRHPRRNNSNFLLSGLVFCAQCGSPLNGDVVKFKQTPQYNYQYYACSREQNKKDCKAKKIPKGTLEKAVIETLSDFILTPENISARQAQYKNELDIQISETARQRTEIAQRLAHVRRQINNITETIADQGITAKALINKIVNLEQEETRLLTDLAIINNDNNHTIDNHTTEYIQDLAMRAKTILNNPQYQPIIRQILTGLVEKITAKRDDKNNLIRGVIHYYYPPGDPVIGPCCSDDNGPPPNPRNSDGNSPSKTNPHSQNTFMPISRNPLGAPQRRHKIFTASFSVPRKPRGGSV